MAVLRERITYGEAAKLSGGFADEAMVRELTRNAVNYLMWEGPGLSIASEWQEEGSAASDRRTGKMSKLPPQQNTPAGLGSNKGKEPDA
jgi:hypothetical protein